MSNLQHLAVFLFLIFLPVGRSILLLDSAPEASVHYIVSIQFRFYSVVAELVALNNYRNGEFNIQR